MAGGKEGWRTGDASICEIEALLHDAHTFKRGNCALSFWEINRTAGLDIKTRNEN
jgi:hypothetical protein